MRARGEPQLLSFKPGAPPTKAAMATPFAHIALPPSLRHSSTIHSFYFLGRCWEGLLLSTGQSTAFATQKTDLGSPRPMFSPTSWPGTATQQLPSCRCRSLSSGLISHVSHVRPARSKKGGTTRRFSLRGVSAMGTPLVQLSHPAKGVKPLGCEPEQS
jgi:hypothetical protein